MSVPRITTPRKQDSWQTAKGNQFFDYWLPASKKAGFNIYRFPRNHKPNETIQTTARNWAESAK